MKSAFLLVLIAGLLAACGSNEAQLAAEAEAVVQVLDKAYDRPESPLIVEPVVVQDEYAIAGWVQGETGGRALLRKEGDAWSIILCAGDAVKEASYLAQTGMAAGTAANLAEALAAAEAGVPAERLEMFSRFGPTVFMNQPGTSHPPAAHDPAGAGTPAVEGHEH